MRGCLQGSSVSLAEMALQRRQRLSALEAFVATQSYNALCSVCLVTGSAPVKRQAAISLALQRGATSERDLDKLEGGVQGGARVIYANTM